MMLELIMLPLGFATGWQVALRTTTDTTKAMLALVVAVAIAVCVWMPYWQAALSASSLAAGFLLYARRP